jgi:hypothetical protein
MTIKYHCVEEFYSGIMHLVGLQLQFDADASDLTITLTGGY